MLGSCFQFVLAIPVQMLYDRHMKQITLFHKIKMNKTLFWGSIFLLSSLLLRFISSSFPTFAEYYTLYVINPLSSILGRFIGLFPFSIMEFGIPVLVGFGIYRLIKMILFLVKNKTGRKAKITSSLSKIFCIASAVFLLFNLIYGVAYDRYPFAQAASIPVQDATESQLIELCTALIFWAAEAREQAEEDENGVFRLDGTVRDTLRRAQAGFDELAPHYPTLAGNFGTVKPMLSSGLISYASILGIYFPFTFEAHINANYTAAGIPFSIAHEMAHQRGYAREDDANFIAFLACIASPYADFRYSGFFNALRYAMSQLFLLNEDAFFDLRDTYSDGMLRDLGMQRQFQEAHAGVVSDIAIAVNDAYLRANLQEEGVQSYGDFVDLLIAFLL